MRRHTNAGLPFSAAWSKVLPSHNRLAWAVLAAVFAAGAARQAAAEKAGYEFFSTAHGQTQHIADVPVNVLLAAAPNAPFYFGGGGVAKQRIIDIEIEKSGPQDSDWRFTALLLKNTGVYQRNSWLIWNLKEEYVKELEQLIDWIPLDIEATWYQDRHGKYIKRYAVVMVENPEQWYWEFAINATQEQIDKLQNDEDLRPIDLDAFDDSLWPWGVPEESFLRYNGVFVDNTGENHLATVALFATEENLADLTWLGFHVIDIQGLPENLVPFLPDDVGWHVVMVQNFNGWWTVYVDSEELHAITASKPNLRMVDLKRDSAGKFLVTFIPQDT